MTGSRRLAWALPPCIVLTAAVWLVVLGRTTPAERALGDFKAGTWVFLLIWFVWATSIAMITTSLVRNGRRPGAAWATMQYALLAILAVGFAAPLLALGGSSPVEAFVGGFSFLILPVAVIVLSAAQGVALFLRA